MKEKNNYLENMSNKERQSEEIRIDEILVQNTEENEEIIRTEDIEKDERVNLQRKVKGITRIIQAIERQPKEVITKYDNKIYDAEFMPMHTHEFTYKLLQKELIKTGYITDLVAEVNAGKEATIYIAHLRGAPLIVKAFRHQLTCHNQAKGNPQLRAAALANREFYLLTKAFNGGVNVPTPAKQINNTIIMRFLGEDWIPAQQLRNTVLLDPETVFDALIEQIWLMYNKAQLIHGDLSEYNILIFREKPFIIDFPQAIDMSLLQMRIPDNIKENLEVLQKDIITVCKYFGKEYHIEYDFKKIYHYIAKKDLPKERVDFTEDEIEKMII